MLDAKLSDFISFLRDIIDQGVDLSLSIYFKKLIFSCPRI